MCVNLYMKNIIIFVEKDSISGFGCAWTMYYYYYLQNDKNIKYSLKYIFVDTLNTKDAIKEFKEYSEKIGCYKAYSFGIYYFKDDLDEIKNIFPNIVINIFEPSMAWKYMYPDKPIPKILQYIDNNNNLENNKEIFEGIKVLLPIGDFNTWTLYIQNENDYLHKCFKIGSIILDVKEQRHAILVDEGKKITINDHKVYVINTTENIVDLGNYVCNLKGCDNKYLVDYCLIWYYNMLEAEFRVYFISNRNIDVLDIASKYNKRCVGSKNIAMFKCLNIFDIIGKNIN